MKQVYLLLILVIGLLAVLVLLPSCNTERKSLKKYVKIQKKYPEWFVRDTIYIDTTIHVRHIDTVYVESDSIEDVVPAKDTTIYSDKLTIQFWKDQYNLMRFKASVAPDTIIRDSIIRVPFNVSVPCPERLSDEMIIKNYIKGLNPWWLGLIIGLFLALIFYRIVK